MWNGKGRFRVAIQDNDPVTWYRDDKGQAIIYLLGVCLILFIKIILLILIIET